MANGEDKPLEMPEDNEGSAAKEEKRPTLSLENDYPGQEESGTASIDAKKVVNPYVVDDYVPIPRGPSNEALVTTGSQALRIPVAVDTSSMQGLRVASDLNSILYADRYSKSDAEALWDQLPVDTQNTLTEIAKAQGGRSGKALWERSVASSYLSTKQGAPRTPWQFIEEGVEKIAEGQVTTGRSGAYSGPRSSVTMANERDLRITTDTIASEVLGRPVTDEEFNKVLKKVRQVERTEPTVTTTTGGMTTTQAGLTAEGRQNIITEALMQGPEAEDFGKATKMMDLFYSALEARPSGA